MEAVYLVCYDIGDPKRLRHVHRATEDRGPRLQYSVYRCELSRMQLATFQAELQAIIDATEDQVLFVRLGPRNASTYGKIESLGRPHQTPEHRSYVI